MKSSIRKEFVIGLLVVLALGILFVGINFLKGVNIFKAANYYYVGYNDVAGLSVSAPVTLNGYKVGLVRAIDYDYSNPGHVLVEISVDKSLRIPQGSHAELVTDILGTATVALKLSGDSEYCAVGDTIAGEVNAGMLAALSDNLLPAVNAIVPKVDTLLTNINTLVADPALRSSVGRLDQITADLQGSLASLRATMAALGPVTKDIKSITANVDTLTGDLTAVSGQLRNAPVDSMLADIQVTIANLKQLSSELNNPNSSVGKMLNDPAMYDNINGAITSLDSLFVDIKRNPKRYINIKVF